MKLPRYINFTIDTQEPPFAGLTGDALHAKVVDGLERLHRLIQRKQVPIDGESSQILANSQMICYMIYSNEKPVRADERPGNQETPPSVAGDDAT